VTHERLGQPELQLEGREPERALLSRASTERLGKEVVALPQEAGRDPEMLLFFTENTCGECSLAEHARMQLLPIFFVLLKRLE